MNNKVPVSKQTPPTWYSQCGPLEALLLDSTVTEIMCNGGMNIFIEQRGIVKKTQARFKDDNELLLLMKKMCATVGRSIGPENPCVDARLPDGSRINCVISPAAVDFPILTIRKFSPHVLAAQNLIDSGCMDQKMAYFLNCCVSARLNVIVAGGTGSGKTTLLNVLSSFIGPHERIVTIEDSAELKIRNDNLVRLEASPASPTQGKPVTIRELVINSLRMRPDRIIVGECRGSEAFDMLVAMNTGHEGSMTTIHANSARETLRRLEGMILMTGVELPIKVVRQNISGAINVVVFIQRQPDGVRRIVEILEVGGMEGDTILTQPIFQYTPNKGFHSMGFVPSFVKIFQEKGVQFPPDFFADLYVIRHQKR